MAAVGQRPGTYRRTNPMNVTVRRNREAAGLSVAHPDWPVAHERTADVALVVHVDDPARAERFIALIPDSGIDVFVMVPTDADLSAIANPLPAHIRVLAADPVADGLYQFAALINSDRLASHHTVIRVLDTGDDAVEFVRVAMVDYTPLGIARVLHDELTVAGYSSSAPRPAGRDRAQKAITERITQLLLRSGGRVQNRDENDSRTLDRAVLRGSIVEGLRALRIDHQDFYLAYTAYVNEGLATESLGVPVADPNAGAAVIRAIFLLIDYSAMTVAPIDQLPAPVSAGGLEPVGQVARARAFATYFPDLTSRSAVRDASWPHIATSTNMFQGQNLPVAPSALAFADPLSREARAAQTTLASAHGIEGFLVMSTWDDTGLTPAAFFDSVADDPHFPWAIVLTHPVLTRNDPVGIRARHAAWSDPGVAHYLATAHRIAELARSGSYLRIDGRPLVVIEGVEMLDDAAAMIGEIRAAVLDTTGIDPWIAAGDVRSAVSRPGEPVVPDGLDGVVQTSMAAYHERFLTRLDARANGYSGPALNMRLALRESSLLIEAFADDRIIPGAIVGFDTTPVLRSQGVVGYNWNALGFARMVRAAVDSVVARDESRRIVVIDSWNGWANLSQLEPSVQTGSSHLAAVRDALYF